jgi:hypothetical protein
MYNLVHYFIGFLAELGLITPEGAKAMDRELSTKVIASSPEEAFNQVHQAVVKVSKDLNLRGDLVKIEPWLSHIELLEKRVSQLEKNHTTLLTIVKEKLSPLESKLEGKSSVNKKPIAKAKS